MMDSAGDFKIAYIMSMNVRTCVCECLYVVIIMLYNQKFLMQVIFENYRGKNLITSYVAISHTKLICQRDEAMCIQT